MKTFRLSFPLFLGMLFSACSCIPLVDKVSLPVLESHGSRSSGVGAEASVTRSETKPNNPSTGNKLSTMGNNTYTPPSYSVGSGSAGSIVCIFDTGSLVPKVEWYRNGALVGAVPSTAINLQLVQHQVRFYNTQDKKWFPDTPIVVNLTTSKKLATIKVKITP